VGETYLPYYPFDQNFTGKTSIACQFETPSISTNGSFKIYAGMGGACQVEWIYRSKVVATTTLSHERLNESQYDIPQLKANIESVKFYEAPFEGVTKDLRKYNTSFISSESRYIYYELNLKYPAPGGEVYFDTEAVWYDSDGKEINRYSTPFTIFSNNKSSWHIAGFGSKEANYWKPGKYRVDLYIDKKKVASESFEVIDGHYFNAAAYQIPEISGFLASIQFYEAGNIKPDKKERQYATQFPKVTSRRIWWDVILEYVDPTYKINFEIEAVYYDPDMKVLGTLPTKTYIEPGNTSSTFARGWGWEEAGNWKTGTYKVTFKIAGNLVDAAYFTIY
jgi:hypothetical protein